MGIIHTIFKFLLICYLCSFTAGIANRKSNKQPKKHVGSIEEVSLVEEIKDSQHEGMLTQLLENNAALIETELDYATELAQLLISTVENELIEDNYISNQGMTFKTLEIMKDAVEVFHEVEHTVLEDVQKRLNSTAVDSETGEDVVVDPIPTKNFIESNLISEQIEVHDEVSSKINEDILDTNSIGNTENKVGIRKPNSNSQSSKELVKLSLPIASQFGVANISKDERDKKEQSEDRELGISAIWILCLSIVAVAIFVAWFMYRSIIMKESKKLTRIVEESSRGLIGTQLISESLLDIETSSKEKVY